MKTQKNNKECPVETSDVKVLSTLSKMLFFTPKYMPKTDYGCVAFGSQRIIFDRLYNKINVGFIKYLEHRESDKPAVLEYNLNGDIIEEEYYYQGVLQAVNRRG